MSLKKLKILRGPHFSQRFPSWHSVKKMCIFFRANLKKSYFLKKNQEYICGVLTSLESCSDHGMTAWKCNKSVHIKMEESMKCVLQMQLLQMQLMNFPESILTPQCPFLSSWSPPFAFWGLDLCRLMSVFCLLSLCFQAPREIAHLAQ